MVYTSIVSLFLSFDLHNVDISVRLRIIFILKTYIYVPMCYVYI